MSRGVKVVLLNDKIPAMDREFNKQFYRQETMDTGVVYGAFNLKTGKEYIGKCFSYEKHGNHKQTPYGAKGRFRRHWSNKSSELAYNECPIFYEALRNSELDDWFIFTLKVSSKNHLKECETRLIKKYMTSNPEYGYNYFVGDNKPDNPEHLAKYQSAKAKANADRAVGGVLRKREHSANLPPNINYRRKEKNGIITEGYFVQIKINGHLYNRAFLARNDTMEEKLKQAEKQLAEFKKTAATAKPENKPKKTKSGSKTLKPNKK